MDNSNKLTIDEIRKILGFISKGYKVPPIVHDTILKIAKREVEDKKRVVLVKRDPDVGSRRIQAMYVKIIDTGDAIEFFPPSVAGFGADFDGDSVSIYVPLSKEAQQQARERMIVATSNESVNSQNYGISNEMILGLYILTTRDLGGIYNYQNIEVKSLSEEDYNNLKLLDPGERKSVLFRGKRIDTTVGQIIFNSVLPKYMDYFDIPADKKNTNKLLKKLVETDKNDYGNTLDTLMKLGFEYATLYPQTVSIDMLESNKELEDLKKKLSQEKDLEKQNNIIDEMETKMMEHLKKNVPDVYTTVVSGASKDKRQVRQMVVSKGLIKDPAGNILPPIVHSLTDGYTSHEYFNAAAGARTGIIGRALNTAYGGYEYRKVLYVVSDVVADINNPDCGTNLTLNVKLTDDLYKRMTYRYVLDDRNRITPINENMIGSMIRLRSPIYCQTRNICRTCYGLLLSQLKTRYVGIVAAQEVASLSERFMKLFHLGGIVEFDTPNLYKEMSTNIVNTNILYEYMEQRENEMYAKKDMTVVVPIKNYVGRYKIDFNKSDVYYELPTGFFELHLGNTIVPIRIERVTELYRTQSINSSSNFIKIDYKSGDKIFKAKANAVDYTKITYVIDALIGGKTPTRDSVPMLYGQFYDILEKSGNWDSVHLEVIISNILRAKKNTQLPARLKKPFEYTMESIKTLPYLIGWTTGLAFENFTKGLKYGLTSDRGSETAIEKIISGGSLTKKL